MDLSKIKIAFVGSRDLAKPIHQRDAKLYYKVAHRCAVLGITMRSGMADGADAIAQIAYSDAIKEGKANTSQLELFVANQQLKDRSILPNKHLALVRNPNLIMQTEDMASKVHPNWNACNEWARAMHSRNCHQIFGYNLDDAVHANICWTENGITKGGTSTAIRLCENANIPVFNLGVQNKGDVLAAIAKFLDTIKGN